MENQRIELIRYFEILVSRRRFVFGVTAAVFLLSLIVSMLLPKTYVATALLLPPVPPRGGVSALLDQFGSSNFSDLLPTPANGPDLYIGLLNSGAVRDAIIERFKLLEEEEGSTREALYRRLAQKVSVAAGRKDSIISVSVEDENPQRAAEMANAYVVALEELVARLSSGSAGKDRAFLEGRLAEAQVALAESEETLKTFLARNKALDIVEQGKSTLEALARLHAERGAQEVRLAAMRQSMTENNPEIRALRGAIANLDKQIAALEGGGEAGDGVIHSVGAMPALGQEYVRLTREYKIREAIVEMLTRQYEMARLGESKNLSGIKRVQSAHVPEKKHKPQRKRIVLLSTYAALIFSILTVFVLERVGQLPGETRERWRRLGKELLSR